jgi:hypothetical protein
LKLTTGVRLIVLSVLLSLFAGAVACGSDRRGEEPTATATASATATPEPSPTSTPRPTATPALAPTTTSAPAPTPTTDPWVFEEPDYPTSREFYILTNVDGGPLLLPYLDASARQTEYALITTFHRTFFYPDEEIATTERTLIRTDGEIFYSELLESTSPDDTTVLGPSAFSTVGFQLIANGESVYARVSGADKWVDVSSLADEQGLFATTNEMGESALGAALFSAASNLILATFGVFDEESIQEIVESSEYSPLLDFKLESSDSEKIVIAHRFSLSAEEEIDGEVSGVHGMHDVVFTIDADSGLIVHAIYNQTQENTGPDPSSDVYIIEHEVDYNPQSFDFPQPGDPSIETDPDKIGAVMGMFE